MLMYSISKCDTTILHITSCALFFYYVNKLAPLIAQQCQAPISPNRILAHLAAAFHLYDFKKLEPVFPFVG